MAHFAPLRERLSRNVRLESVGFVQDRSGVFTGVLQETCLAVFSRRRVRKTTVLSMSGGESTSVARVPTPTGDAPWLLPRSSSIAMVAAGAGTMPTTLGQLGWKVSTDPLVWNRRREDLHSDRGPDRVPIVWAGDIDGGRLHRDPRRDDKRFLRLASIRDAATMELREPAILVQRTAAPESPRKLVCAALTEEHLLDSGGAKVIENHVNVLRPTTSKIDLALMVRVLSTPTLDAVTRCVSGSVALSAYELMALPMPSEETITEWAELNDTDLNRVVAQAYRPRGA